MHERQGVPFASLTTLRVGGEASKLIEASTCDEVVDVVRDLGRDAYLVLGGGSNLVVSDDVFLAPVIAVRTSGFAVHRDGDEVRLEVAAGEPWDVLVERCVSEGWGGVEALSGIPGSVGATPIQNVGAYGQEVADVISRVEVFDHACSRIDSLVPADCDFGYRSSRFKKEPGRFVVLSVTFQLSASAEGSAVHYADLARTLGVSIGDAAPLADVRAAVVDLRRGKGMVLDDKDHDTWSAGSFFMNPVLAASDVPVDAPQWVQGNGRVKTSAAWLIEQAGFGKGFGADLGTGRATLSTKHTLAITNRGGATTDDVLRLARTIRAGVLERFGVTLNAEPTLVGVTL